MTQKTSQEPKIKKIKIYNFKLYLTNSCLSCLSLFQLLVQEIPQLLNILPEMHKEGAECPHTYPYLSVQSVDTFCLQNSPSCSNSLGGKMVLRSILTSSGLSFFFPMATVLVLPGKSSSWSHPPPVLEPEISLREKASIPNNSTQHNDSQVFI